MSEDKSKSPRPQNKKMTNPERSIVLFTNFATRTKASIMNPFTSKNGNPKARSFQYLPYNYPVFKKIIEIMNQEIYEKVAWTPYARRTFDTSIPRGDINLLNAALQEARDKVHIADPHLMKF